MIFRTPIPRRAVLAWTCPNEHGGNALKHLSDILICGNRLWRDRRLFNLGRRLYETPSKADSRDHSGDNRHEQYRKRYNLLLESSQQSPESQKIIAENNHCHDDLVFGRRTGNAIQMEFNFPIKIYLYIYDVKNDSARNPYFLFSKLNAWKKIVFGTSANNQKTTDNSRIWSDLIGFKNFNACPI